jgi:malate permease and related proteins
MLNTLIQMSALMLCGAVWRWWAPNGLNAELTRRVLTGAVFHFFLPAMVLNVLWQADIGLKSLKFTALGISNVAAGILICMAFAHGLRLPHRQSGAMILAAAYANVTYLGLPVLEQTYGDWARAVVIQIDLFAVAPMVFSAGFALARYYGENDGQPHKPLWTAFNTPPFWAAWLAILLSVNDIPQPEYIAGLLNKLSATVAPLMLFSLGMALQARAVHWRNLIYIGPGALIKLGLLPLLAWQTAQWLDIEQPLRAAAIMDLAMPSMVLGIVICDQYRLDSALYATLVTVTTALSLFTLPLWHNLL